jgi:diguanylate cyclase (GGDEF)-like protein
MNAKIGELTEKKSAQLSLDINEREKLFHSIFESCADAIIVSDSNGIIRLLNHNAEQFLNLPSEKIIGGKIKLPCNNEPCKEVSILRQGKDDGIAEVHSVEIKLSNTTLHVATLHDITELVRLREELKALTFVDDLVDLCNRRGFFTLAQQQLKLANRTKKGLYLFLISVDNLKQVNDKNGQQAADRMIVQAAQIIKDTFRKSDIIARVSNEIFAVLAIEAQSGSTDIIGERLQANLEKYNAEVTPEQALLASMATAYYDPAHPCSIDTLFGYADMLLYRQKNGKRKSALLWYLEKNTDSRKN